MQSRRLSRKGGGLGRMRERERESSILSAGLDDISSSLPCRATCTDFPDSLSLAIRLYHPSLPAGLLDYNLCPDRAVVDKF